MALGGFLGRFFEIPSWQRCHVPRCHSAWVLDKDQREIKGEQFGKIRYAGGGPGLRFQPAASLGASVCGARVPKVPRPQP